MASFNRMVLILAAFVLGNFIAVNILSAGKVLADFDNLRLYSQWDYVGGGLPGYVAHLLVSTVQSMILAVIPTLLVLIPTETLSIRSKWFYISAAGFGAFLFDVACTKFTLVGMRSFCVSLSVSELVIATIAGMTAGYIFWRVAGKYSGGWCAPAQPNHSAVA